MSKQNVGSRVGARVGKKVAMRKRAQGQTKHVRGRVQRQFAAAHGGKKRTPVVRPTVSARVSFRVTNVKTKNFIDVAAASETEALAVALAARLARKPENLVIEHLAVEAVA